MPELTIRHGGSWLRYEGEVKDGVPHGEGTVYTVDDYNPFYTGEWRNGDRHGIGTSYLYYSNGSTGKLHAIWKDGYSMLVMPGTDSYSEELTTFEAMQVRDSINVMKRIEKLEAELKELKNRANN